MSDLIHRLAQRVGIPVPDPKTMGLIGTGTCILVTLPFIVLFYLRGRPRFQHIPPYRERVVIIGASKEKGVGQALAVAYASRGCRNLLLVARDEEGLERVRQKCISEARRAEDWDMSNQVPGEEEERKEGRVEIFKADCTDPEQVDSLRRYVQDRWGGLDTLHICLGVSALKPLLGVASVDPITDLKKDGEGHRSIHPDVRGLESVKDAVNRASEINLTSTALILTALIPTLQTTSPYPSVALMSSVAALLPAPTRSIYASTKSSQLSLFRSVAIECSAHSDSPNVGDQQQSPKRSNLKFLSVCPGTISTSFRESAVDGGDPGQPLSDSNVSVESGKALTPAYVAEKTILAVDRHEEGIIVLPRLYQLATWLEKIFPSYIHNKAKKKYNYGC
ncbi:NAD(P)-binding protein [Violaceomyces palustris]|uniref:NAD(P)-binding protein n=1 Tax=Violaceomyces palustris TaxID=1673888 RepID=A0ACD0NX85_9BASI|nr:NAD(P)-binding protein [Violaceomyces palustris]